MKKLILTISIGLLWVSQSYLLHAQSFPSNFAGLQLATGLDPVSFDIAPDGRIFITEKNGTIWVVKNGTKLTAPFVTIPNVDTYNERGLDGIVLDPDFINNNYIYVYYTKSGSPSRNRVSRFTANGDIAVPNSETLIFELDPLNAGVHNGGGLLFKNGKLYIAVGENQNASNSQSLANTHGKILRINPDGSIPSDNPFYSTLSGSPRSIYALGFRNPFRMAVQPGTGKIFVNDVGASSFEEINELQPGKNYGWPQIEGYRSGQTPPANYLDPVYAYNHGDGCAITGGDFYNPSTTQFPAVYVGKYFFADYCNGWIKTYDPATGNIANFATGLDRPIDIRFAPDGSLYYIARGGIGGGSVEDNTSSNEGVLWKVSYTGNGAPVIAVQPTNKTVSVGSNVTFTVNASGNPAPSYQWQRNGTNISGATAASYTLNSVTMDDNDAKFRVIVSNSAGTVTSAEATLSVNTNQKPVVTITSPAQGTKYVAGNTIVFSGTGTDTEDGDLPASSYSWRILLNHFDVPVHSHPAMDLTTGIKNGTFTIPTSMETSPNVRFRIFLTVRDSQGQTSTDSVEINPILVNITLATNPNGLRLALDGTILTSTPFSFTAAAGVERNIEVMKPQTRDGATYNFYSWSDGGAGTHLIYTPSVNTTYTGNFIRQSETPSNLVQGIAYTYYEGSFDQIPDFNVLTSVKSGLSSTFGLSERNRNDLFAFRFNGYINVPTDGLYSFYTTSDDGSLLSIGNDIVVNNDGLHGASEKQGSIYLKAGYHPIIVSFFEKNGDEILSVSYAGPGIAKQLIPASSLYSISSGTTGGGEGTGLIGQYFNNKTLTAPVALTRLDAAINFDWQNGSPGPSVNPDNFSVRWTGQIEAPVSGSYIFSTYTDDGVRLWINGTLVINNWTDHGPTLDNSSSIPLVAGQKYNVEMEFYENGGGAVAGLQWAYPGQVRQPIPQNRLYTTTSPVITTSGSGLNAEYYNNQTLTPPSALTRTDAKVDFDWGTNAPAPGVNADNFSVRWSGQVEAPVSGNYIFSTTTDDGVRLNVNGLQMINNWTYHSSTTDVGTGISLIAGQKYNITLEYYEGAVDAVAKLQWSYPGQTGQIIPQAYLYPVSGARINSENATDFVKIFPNPAKSEVNVQVEATQDAFVDLYIRNIIGDNFNSSSYNISKGRENFKINVSNYPAGVYILEVVINGQHYYKKFMIE